VDGRKQHFMTVATSRGRKGGASEDHRRAERLNPPPDRRRLQAVKNWEFAQFIVAMLSYGTVCSRARKTNK